jgi:hypothetical protein
MTVGRKTQILIPALALMLIAGWAFTAGAKKKSPPAEEPAVVEGAPTPPIFYARLSTDNKQQGDPLANVVGDGQPEDYAARANRAIEAAAALMGDSDDVSPATRPEGWPGLASSVAPGWGDSEAEAARNAVARLEEIQMLRKQALMRTLLYNVGPPAGEQLGAVTWTNSMWMDGAETGGSADELQQALAAEMANLLWAETAGAGETTVVGVGPMDAGEAKAVWRPTESRCGPGLELDGAPQTGAGYDLLATQLCRAYAAESTRQMFGALAHASAENKASLANSGLRIVDTCHIQCLQGVTLVTD